MLDCSQSWTNLTMVLEALSSTRGHLLLVPQEKSKEYYHNLHPESKPQLISHLQF